MPLSLRQLRLIFSSLILITIAWLGFEAFAPFGRQTYHLKPCRPTRLTSALTPRDRTQAPGKDCTQRLTGDPVYFSVATQRSFDAATVTVTYRTAPTVPIVELGLLADAQKHYRLTPLQNTLIDELSWPTIAGENGYLLQREARYANVGDFLRRLPEPATVRTYHYALPVKNTVPLAPADPLPFHSVRGSYQFFSAFAGDIETTFTFEDVNENATADDVTLLIYYNGNLIDQREMPDKRGGEESRTRQPAGELRVAIPGAPAGTYRVAVQTTDDIITTDLKTTARSLAFINRLWLAQTSTPQPITVFADVAELALSTPHPASRQTVQIGDTTLDLNEPFRQFTTELTKAFVPVTFSTGGVIVAGNGLFSFNSEPYNPVYRSLDRKDSLASSTVSYVITSYRPQAPQVDWQTRSVSFNLTEGLRYDGAYGFLLSAPGLRADDDRDDWIEVKEIIIEMEGKTAWEKIREVIKK